MEKRNNLKEQKYLRAKKRVVELKKFYKHLVFYLLVNFFFIGRRIYKDIVYNDVFFIEALFDLDNYNFFFWWGIALIIHGIAVFGSSNFFSKDWEERKIKEYMNNNK